MFVQLTHINLDILDSEHFDARHLVSGQSTGFVRANNWGTTQSLDRWEGANDGVLLGHTVSTQGKASGDDSGKTFWDSSDGQGDGNLIMQA